MRLFLKETAIRTRNTISRVDVFQREEFIRYRHLHNRLPHPPCDLHLGGRIRKTSARSVPPPPPPGRTTCSSATGLRCTNATTDRPPNQDLFFNSLFSFKASDALGRRDNLESSVADASPPLDGRFRRVETHLADGTELRVTCEEHFPNL